MNRFFAIATRHFKPLLGLNLLLWAGVAYAIYQLPVSWEAKAKLIVPSTSGALDANLGKLGQLRGSGLEVSPQLNPLTMLSSVLLSDDTMTALWQLDPEREQFETVEAYSQLFSVKPEESTTILALAVGADEPALAQQRLNNLIDLFGDRLSALRSGESAERARFTDEELVTAEQRLLSAQTELSRFQERSGLVSSETQTLTTVESLAQLRQRDTDLRAAQQATQTQLNILQAHLDLTPGQAAQSLALGEDETYQFLQRRMAEIDGELAEVNSIYQVNHPLVQSLVSERQKLQTQSIEQLLKTTRSLGVSTDPGPRSSELMQQLVVAEATARAQIEEASVLQAEIQRLEQRLLALPQEQAKLAELQRAYDIAEGFYNGLVAQAKESNLNAFSAYPSIQVLDQPDVSAQPVGPKLSLMLLGALLASGFGSVALLLLLESRNPLLSPADVLAANLPVLGAVPMLSARSQQLIGHLAPDLAFQRLASAISMMDLAHKRILVSSAAASEGKTTVTIGLGRALAALGFRVLLVDGDFYQAGMTLQLKATVGPRSQTHEILGAPVNLATGLDLMPTAPGQQGRAMEFVARGEFATTLNLVETAGRYDYILVDSAPVELTSETPLMGAVTENVLLVARAGFSERDQVYRTLQVFARHRVRLLGLLINQAVEQPARVPKSPRRQSQSDSRQPAPASPY